MNPGMAFRSGILWSQYPVLTDNFEIAMSITVNGTEKRGVEKAGLALWYVYENVSQGAGYNISTLQAHDQVALIHNTWIADFEKQGFDLYGYRSKFDGLGVFFADHEQPTVAMLANDGSASQTVDQVLNAPNALKFNFQTGQEVGLKLRVQPTGAKLEVTGQPAIEIKGAFRAGGYIGLTCYGGTPLQAAEEIAAAGGAPARSPLVEMKTLQTVNFDQASKGEAVPAMPTAVPARLAAEERSDVLHESSSFRDFRAESDAIKDLTNTVFKLVVETKPMQTQLANAIDSLSTRITRMEDDLAALKSAVDQKSGHKLDAEFAAIKGELSSLSGTTHRDTQERHQRLESLHKDIAEVHKTAHSSDTLDKHLDKLSKSNDKILEQLSSEHHKMFGVSIGAVAFVMVAGLSLYNRFHCWDKTHIL